MRAALLLCAAAPTAADLNFVAVGDWGYDNSGEYACAAGMGKVAADIGAQFSVMLGDNFYGSGIHEPGDGPDGLYRFNKTFEQVYNATSLQNIPFYGIAGNHDHGGNVTAQMAYGKHYKTRWFYPDWYYGVKKEFPVQTANGAETRTLEILLFDSVIGFGSSDKRLPNGTEVQLKGDEYPGPAPEFRSIAEDQWKWLNASIRQSTADYLWVGAHYPVWSISNHGPTKQLVEQLRPLLGQYDAQYFCGHDHVSEHIVDGGINHIVTGAGMSCCYGDSHLDAVRQGAGNDAVKFAMVGGGGSGYQLMPFPMKSGFTSYRAGAESMTVHFHAHNGTELYVTPPIKRRTGPYPRPTPAPQPVPPTPPTPAPAPLPKGCNVSPPGTTYKWGAGNLFPNKPNHGGNYGPSMVSPAQCCALCQSFKNCTFWTYSAGGTTLPTCYNQPGGCCFLNTAAAAAGKKVNCPTCTAGSTKPLGAQPQPIQSWECHYNKTGSFGQDKDLGGVGPDISDCEKSCAGTAGCSAILWHKTDAHCRIRSGAISHAGFLKLLKDDAGHDSCIAVR